MNINFANPYYLLLLLTLLIPIMKIIQKKHYGRILFGSIKNLPKTKPTIRSITAGLLPFFYIVALTLLIIALAAPQSVTTKKTTQHNATAIEMLLDISSSMNSTYSNNVSRLDAAKSAFSHFVEQRQYDLMGLISFSGYAISRAPLTSNHKILLQLLNTLSSDKNEYVSQQETLTAMGDAIVTACAHLKNAKPESKIIILITDGISNSGIIPPVKAAYIAKKLNIRIYAININRQTDSSDLLTKITNIADGRTFFASDTKKLKQVLTDINQMEKTEVTISSETITKKFTPPFIIAALFLIIVATTLNLYLTGRII